MQWGLVLLCVAYAVGTRCNEQQFKTDTSTRTVYKCVGGTWKFHGKMIRPRDMTPIKAAISNKCPNNPDLKSAISGFPCDAAHDMQVLDCLNTKMAYICHDTEWQIYVIRGSG